MLRTNKSTKELILFIIDDYLYKSEYKIEDPQLLCVSSIFFILKLQADLTEEIEDFLNFVRKDIQISVSNIRSMEYSLLMKMPDDLCLISPFEEILIDCQKLQNNLPKPYIEYVYKQYIINFINHGVSSHFMDQIFGVLLTPASGKAQKPAIEENIKEILKSSPWISSQKIFVCENQIDDNPRISYQTKKI